MSPGAQPRLSARAATHGLAGELNFLPGGWFFPREAFSENQVEEVARSFLPSLERHTASLLLHAVDYNHVSKAGPDLKGGRDSTFDGRNVKELKNKF